MFADQVRVVQTVYAMKRMGTLFVLAKLISLALPPTVNQNVLLMQNAHKIKHVINLNVKILALELVESKLVI